MTFQLSTLGFYAAVCLMAPLTVSASAHAQNAPAASSKAEQQKALEQAVMKHITQSGLGASLRGYALAPAIVQLRRYTEPGTKQVKVVCIVSLAVKNQREELLAEVRGSAAALGGSTADAVDAAVGSAVARMPEVLGRVASR